MRLSFEQSSVNTVDKPENANIEDVGLHTFFKITPWEDFPCASIQVNKSEENFPRLYI